MPRAVMKLAVTEYQNRFVAPNAWSLGQALFSREAWYRAIHRGEEPVGFVMLADQSLLDPMPGHPEVEVWRFMVDARHQRQGIGRAAMRQVIDHVRRKGLFTSISISYVPGEGSPEPLYRSLGFRPTGEIDEGEVVMALPLDPERPPDPPAERAATDPRWSTLRWSIGDALPRDDVQTVSARVLDYGRSLAADGNARLLACLVRDGSGAVVAGASGRTEHGRLFVNSLWVDEALRGTGIGTELLRRMEQAALSRGCHSAMLETLGERACALYRRVGYEPVAHVPGCVGPFDRVILLKPLERAEA
jgi:diamine N-acetyltransferase